MPGLPPRLDGTHRVRNACMSLQSSRQFSGVWPLGCHQRLVLSWYYYLSDLRSQLTSSDFVPSVLRHLGWRLSEHFRMLEEYTEKQIRGFQRLSPRRSRYELCLPVSYTDAVVSSAFTWRQNVGACLSLHVMHIAYVALLGLVSAISLFLRRSLRCGCRGSVSIVFGVSSLTAWLLGSQLRM